MMLNSRFELSKIEKNTRVEREICLATLENREWKENLFLPLSKIESRKRIVSCHSRKSRVEREMGTIKFSRSREKFLFLLSIFLSRVRLLSMPDLYPQVGGPNPPLNVRIFSTCAMIRWENQVPLSAVSRMRPGILSSACPRSSLMACLRPPPPSRSHAFDCDLQAEYFKQNSTHLILSKSTRSHGSFFCS